MISGRVRHERWTLREPFVIAGHRYEETDLVLVELESGGFRGRGESTPTSYYGETVESVLAQAAEMVARLEGREAGAWADHHDQLPAGAARNAVDCAVWDLRAKQAGTPAWRLAGLSEPRPVATAMTVSLGAPEAMAEKARTCGHEVVKLKVGEGGASVDEARVAAVRSAVPGARLVVDANQAWSVETLQVLMPVLARLGVAMIEQPLPRGADGALASFAHAVPLCADESCHVSADVAGLVGRYDMVNLKLDKTGGLTEAIRFMAAARAAGLGLMIGCMEGTSLAMAPATLLAGQAEVVDLDGPLLIGSDRPAGLRYSGGVVFPPEPTLWG
jgi:L-alanine-DL-glutamate epimerase-like enolase superfamily enzyme